MNNCENCKHGVFAELWQQWKCKFFKRIIFKHGIRWNNCEKWEEKE